MEAFRFVTVWKIEAPLPPVWEAMFRFEDWPTWWKGVERVEVLQPGDANRIGFRSRQTWKSKLPYKLRFEGEIVRVSAMSLLEVHSQGELQGTGLMRFSNDGSSTTFQYDWEVSTSKSWMNLVAPVAKPLFSWNHDVIMDWGAEGLARKLGCKRVSTSKTAVF